MDSKIGPNIVYYKGDEEPPATDRKGNPDVEQQQSQLE